MAATMYILGLKQKIRAKGGGKCQGKPAARTTGGVQSAATRKPVQIYSLHIGSHCTTHGVVLFFEGQMCSPRHELSPSRVSSSAPNHTEW